MNSFLAILLFILASINCYAKDRRFKADFAGMIGASYFNETATVTFGGPRLSLERPQMTFSLSFYPSLLLSDYPDNDIRPALGFGPEISFEHLVIFVPTYYLLDRYRTTIGVGYRF
jgi:hypothetical protein